jgi:hypothetical protein
MISWIFFVFLPSLNSLPQRGMTLFCLSSPPSTGQAYKAKKYLVYPVNPVQKQKRLIGINSPEGNGTDFRGMNMIEVGLM